MKLKSTLISLTALLLLMGLWPVTSQANNALKQEITLLEAIEKISKEYEVYFTFDMTLVVDVRVEYEQEAYDSAEEAIANILLGTDLKYQFYDQRFVILYKEDAEGLESLKQMSRHLDGLISKGEKTIKRTPKREISTVPLLNTLALSKSIKPIAFSVEGTVTDQEGEPLIGVNIQVKGTNKGTATDIDGRFSFSDIDDQAVLVLSYIGYTTQEVPVEGKTSLTIIMQADVHRLDEVVVVGYGTQERKDVTGSISSISSENFNPGIQKSPEQLIQGRVAGVQISQSSGEPGGGISIHIRGVGSINAGNSPLYVIDGIAIDNSPLLPQAGGAGTSSVPNSRNPLNSLNVNDIESIDILKDASATAIYGSRAANGVVLITTKGGKLGEMKIDYGMKIGHQSISKKLDLLSAQEYMDVINEISLDRGDNIVFTDKNRVDIQEGTDWQSEILRSQAIMTDNNFSLSGGNESSKYFLSLNYSTQDGIVRNTGMQNYGIRTNLDFRPYEKIDISLKLSAAKVENENNAEGRGFNESSGPINSALGYDPTEPIYNEDGSFARSSFLTINNPVSVLEGILSENEVKRFLGNLGVKYNITSHLYMNLNIGLDAQSDRRDLFNTTKTIRGSSFGGLADIRTLNRENYLVEFTSSYKNLINNNNEITLLSGVSYQHFSQERFNGGLSNFPTDNIRTYNLGLGDISTVSLNSNKTESKLMSFFGRLNYQILNRYLVTATLRADGSSKFGENNRYGVFPSVAIGWRMAEEGFFPSIFNEFKPRLSWGITGNQDIGNNRTEVTFVSSKDAIFDGQRYGSINPSRIASPSLKWESTQHINFGIDVSMSNNRIKASLDYFVKSTKDMLINMPLPLSSGFSSRLINLDNAEVHNKGFEVLIESDNLRKGDFNWISTFTFSAIKNIVSSMGGASRIITGNLPFVSNSVLIDEGVPLGSYFGHRILGNFQESDNIANSPQPSAKPGYPIVEDSNGDGRIDNEDRVILGDPFPDFIYGFQNSFSYSNFQLSVFIEGKHGNDVINMNAVESLYPQNFRRNRFREHGIDRWTPENPNAKFPSGTFPTSYDGSKINSLTVQDASFLRVKTLTISYNVPQNFFRNIVLTLTGQNVITITKYNGFNPESNLFGGNGYVHADYNAYPLAKTFSLGINFGL